MPKNGLYTTVVFGPTGAGKSQFCNFAQKDLGNSINKVSNSLNSCTQDPQSNYFNRKGIDLELIDTAGSNDSQNRDIENLDKVCKYLNTKNQIDYIILLLNFEDRLSSNTREYIQTLGKIFTPKEFYTHLCIIFTHLPQKENKKVKEKKKLHKEEVSKILKEMFKIKEKDYLPEVKVYFLNTEIDEDEDENKSFDEKSQLTVDIIIEQMTIDVSNHAPINTTNLETSGINAKKREEEQLNRAKQLEEYIKNEEIRKKKDEEEKKRLRKEIEKRIKDDEERKRKEKELKEIERRQEEERKKLEKMQKEAQAKEEENRKKEEAIKKLASENKIDIQTLDNVIDGAGYFAAGAGIGAGAGVLLFIGGAALTCVCPVAGPFLMAFGIGAAGGGAAEAAIAGGVAGVTKIIKEVNK